MVRIFARVKSQYGIHARPSAVIATAAKDDFPHTEITLFKVNSEESARALSVLEIMILALPCGASVIIQATGDDEQKAAETIANIIETFEVEIK